MAEYHVQLNNDNEIIAGAVSKTGKFTNSSIVTEEVMRAVRDHIIALSQKEKTDICYRWNYNNGKSIILKLEAIDTENIKEENKEESNEKV